MVSREAAIAAHHFGLGARPGELDRLGDPRGWLDAQVSDPRRFGLAGRDLVDRAGGARATIDARDAAESGGVPDFRTVLRAELEARFTRALTTPDGFAERLVWFWSNHFTVSAQGKTAAWVGLYEREVVRGHLAGRFEDLLLASCQHPGMLSYLDQAQSVGPASVAGKLRDRGLNENLAREILELHTLGVAGGYTQADVTELARALTGWTISMPRTQRFTDAPLGDFAFIPAMHEPGPRSVVGVRAPAGGVEQAERLLRALAGHPSTARHLATKLARHFVADDPPKSAIDALERAWMSSGGDLPTVHRALVALPEAWSSEKRRAPVDFAVAALRALDVTTPPPALVRALDDLGQPPFRAPSPAGWPDTAAEWSGPDALMRRVEWARVLASAFPPAERPDARMADVLGPLLRPETRLAVARAETATQGFVLGFMSPEFQCR